MPEYLSKTNYVSPTQPTDGIFQYTKGWKGDLFQYYDTHPEESRSFDHIMGGVMAHQASWLDVFPHDTFLESDPNLPLLVDVGGNVGHDIEKFRQAHPETASRLYLEDRPEVVRRSKCLDPVNKMGYDFFTPQSIKGKTKRVKVEPKEPKAYIRNYTAQGHGHTTCTVSSMTGPMSPPEIFYECRKKQ